MSRSADLAHIESQLAVLKSEAEAAVTKFNNFAKEVSDSIQGILKDAGVYDQIEALENLRAKARTSLQEQVKGLNDKVQDLIKVRDYLASLPPESVPATPTKSTSVREKGAKLAPSKRGVR